MIRSNNHVKNQFFLEEISTSNHQLLRNIRSVPTIHIQESSKFLLGRKAFEYVESELNLHLNAFEDYSEFSYIHAPDDPSNSGSNCAYLLGEGYDIPNSIDKTAKENPKCSSKENDQNKAFESFMEQRKNETPQPLKRV
jgi:hypothetical protein